MRVGLRLTPVTVTSLFGNSDAATSKNAADEKSPGTVKSSGCSSLPGCRTMVSPCVTRSAPIAASIRSVWSRAGPGWTTAVAPLACNPANKIALFTWALATGILYLMPCNDAGLMCSGARPSMALMLAPIICKGWMIRFIGRRRSWLLPSRALSNGCPARMPASSRNPVPELTRFNGLSAGLRAPP